MKNRLVFTFGRFNPPTTGHEKLLDKVAEVAGDDDYLIFPSHTQKKDNNPLDSKTKSDYMKKMFPQHSDKIVYDTSLKTIINVLSRYQGDYMYATVVVGSDRVQQFKILTAKYNGKDYTFRGIDVQSAGERDPDADGLTGMSEVTSVMGVKVVRPLLAVSQVMLKDYAHAHGVVWVDDPSNESVAYARNEIRRQCSSLFNKSALSLTMQHLNRQSGLIKEQTALYLKQVLIDGYTIDLDLLRQLPKGWQLEVFHYWVDQQAGVKLALERTQQVLHSFLSAAEDRQPEERVGACIIRRYRQRLTSYSYEQPPKVMLTCQREIVVPMGAIVNPERKRLRIYLGVQFPGGKKQYQKMGVAPWLRTAVPWVVVLPSHQPYLIGDKYLTDQGIVLEKMAMC